MELKSMVCIRKFRCDKKFDLNLYNNMIINFHWLFYLFIPLTLVQDDESKPQLTDMYGIRGISGRIYIHLHIILPQI